MKKILIYNHQKKGKKKEKNNNNSIEISENQITDPKHKPLKTDKVFFKKSSIIMKKRYGR